MKICCSIVFYLCLAGASAYAQEDVQPELPYSADHEIKPLRQLMNSDLQSKLESSVNKNPAWAKLISQRKLTIGLVDISDPDQVRFARINGAIMMYAASLPKLAILLAAFQSLEDGSLAETPQTMQDLRIMISKSSNPAATRIYDKVGFEKIEAVLTDDRYELYDPDRGGGLWVGKRYGKSGKRRGDPLKDLSHAATATQVCRFYYLLAFGRLVNQKRSTQMLDILSEPELHHKFVNTLDRIVPDAVIYRKSGSWRNWHSDSVLVWGPVWRRYILVALVEDKRGERILRDLVPVVEEALQHNSN